MDRKKHSSFFERFFSSVIDSVLQKSTTEVAILHGEIKTGEIKNILIPYNGNIHTQLAAEIAPALIEFFNAEIRFAVVFSPGTTIDGATEKNRSDKFTFRRKQNISKYCNNC